MKEIVLFDGCPEVSTGFVGTQQQPRARRDRWGYLRDGEVRHISVELRDPKGDTYMTVLDVPQHWFKAGYGINLKITAEITAVRKG